MAWFKLSAEIGGISIGGKEVELRDGMFEWPDEMADSLQKEVPGIIRVGPPDWTNEQQATVDQDQEDTGGQGETQDQEDVKDPNNTDASIEVVEDSSVVAEPVGEV